MRGESGIKRLSWMLAVLLLSGCSWFGGDDESEDAELEPAELEDFVEEVKIRKLWSTDIGSGQKEYLERLRPVVVDGKLYAADGKGRVTALDASRGKRLWRVDLDVDLSGGVGVGGGQVLVGNRDGRLYALNADDGVQLWQAQLSSEILAPAVSNGEIVAVQTEDGRLVGLDAATGEEAWRYDSETPVLTLYGTSTPLIARRMVIAGFANGKVVGVDINKGTQLWESRLTVPRGRTELDRLIDIDGDMLLDGEILYVSGYRGAVAALSRSTGRTIWTQPASSYLGPALANNRIYVVEDEDKVRALRSNGGQELWANESLFLRRLVAPVAIGDFVAVADGEGYLHILAGEDGRFVGRTRVDGSGIRVPMTTDGGTIYVQDNDGGVKAYQIVDK